ncbi:hypothetical protein O7599_24820 [Streptomyces sp. WMMC500]|uniref:hypothetical protein n=1 Tax=Streptomyces sp. WMMC500 TaxID=3015154 RepID=UPI00248B791D|nr:hypothetical protein [Streptomyces sp. WMMC500]WBB58820.1 hypothetical protein O7599_24820 [Streptomyces sp. WMMC500]
MEENKGLNVTPVYAAAATDPAALPGLVSPPPDEKEEDEATTTDETQDPETDTEDTEDADTDGDGDGEEDTAESEAEAKDDDGAEDEDEATGTGDAAGDGPVFEATDRRGSVTVDSTGVRFQLDDTEAEFTWPEIGAVEYKTSRFGRRLVLSVHDSRGICPAEVEAPDKGTLKQWASDLESTLDAYFEESS